MNNKKLIPFDLDKYTGKEKLVLRDGRKVVETIAFRCNLGANTPRYPVIILMESGETKSYTKDGHLLYLVGVSEPRDTDLLIEVESKLIPWTADDVPMPCWIRLSTQPTNVVLVVGIDDHGLSAGGYPYKFHNLLESYEHSTTGKAPWFPCGKEE